MITEHYKPIITPDDIRKLARPCDVDRDVAERAIEEASLLDIKPKLGEALFVRLVDNVKYSRLLEGGDYEDADGNVHVFAGLRRALAYYSWGRLVKTATNHLTRFGYVKKNDDYSHATEIKERQIAANDAFSVADGYIQECFVYMANNPEIFPDYKGNGRLRSYRTRTKIIGK
ncbi:MAG: hypothetical protein IJQ81_06620 [Oscillibacter sp.]|nr:hypothetical protein [Oscillibacter sp.]